MRALTFDIWYTLLDDRKYKNERMQFRINALKTFSNDINDSKIELAFKKEKDNYLSLWREQKALTIEERAESLLTLIGINLPSKEDILNLSIKLEEAMLVYPPELINGAEDILQWAFKKKYPMVIISDVGIHSGRILREVLKKLNINQYFKGMIFSDEIGVTKPSALPFLKAKKILGINNNIDICHIGDRENTDIEGAFQLNMKSILFTKITPFSSKASNANLITDNFTDIKAYLDMF